uniref:Uncharacterized protein n=1 Tax=Brassica oleracea var. oleracea TaxID=109376 RepID=A0A0D3D9X1_BRAOL
MKMNWCMERVIWRMKTITDDENDYEDDADDEEDDGQNVTLLLNPDENIAQWKAVKAKQGLYRSFNVFYIYAYDLVRRKAIGSRGKKEQMDAHAYN